MPTLGLSMIAKNEAHTLRPCLASVAGVVSQIVIADTGSSDDTAATAREFGATVLSVPWNNHFAEARNAALRPLQTDWILVLDADEELDSQAGTKIQRLIASGKADGYLIPIRNYIPVASGRGWDRSTQPNDGKHPRAQDAPAYFVHENCRLFRRNPEIYFVGRVHELVEHRFKALGLKLGMANFCIHHFGQLAGEESRKHKALSYRDLLRKKIVELPDDVLAWVQLGLQEYECSREPAEPLRYLERALALQPKMAQAWLFKGMIHLESGNYQAALAALEMSGGDGNEAALREHLRGDALHNLGQLEEARAAYAKTVKLTRADPVPNSKLGYTEVRLGRATEGLSRLKQAVESAPKLTEIRERLMKAYVVLNRLPEAAEQAGQLAVIEGTAKSYLRAISIYVHLRRIDTAWELVNRGINLFPDAAELRRARAELEGSQVKAASPIGT